MSALLRIPGLRCLHPLRSVVKSIPRTLAKFILREAHASSLAVPSLLLAVPKAAFDGVATADAAPPNVQIAATNNDELSFYNISVSSWLQHGWLPAVLGDRAGQMEAAAICVLSRDLRYTCGIHAAANMTVHELPQVTWSEAATFCQRRGGDLISFRDQDEIRWAKHCVR